MRHSIDESITPPPLIHARPWTRLIDQRTFSDSDPCLHPRSSSQLPTIGHSRLLKTASAKNPQAGCPRPHWPLQASSQRAKTNNQTSMQTDPAKELTAMSRSKTCATPCAIKAVASSIGARMPCTARASLPVVSRARSRSHSFAFGMKAA